MLFRPYKPIGIGSLTFQGLIPKRQNDLALKIGAVVSEKLVSSRDLVAVLNDPEIHSKTLATIENAVDSFIKDQLSALPMIGMFLQGPILDQIKKAMVKHLDSALPGIVTTIADQAATKLDIQKIVSQRVAEFDCRQLEKIIYEISSRELKAIEYWGAILGFLVGLVQLYILKALPY
jgi:uncharacterized membrane protein YheB (UPF0754 family)